MVVQLFKSGDSSKMNNYRPISILPICERIMYNNVFNFMNEKELIYKHQFGVHQKYSAQQAILYLVDKITKSLDSEDILECFWI